jgi:hypothetical protein
MIRQLGIYLKEGRLHRKGEEKTWARIEDLNSLALIIHFVFRLPSGARFYPV